MNQTPVLLLMASDDSSDAFRRYLEGQGFQVLCPSTFEDAERILKQETIAFGLVDPRWNGRGFLPWLQSLSLESPPYWLLRRPPHAEIDREEWRLHRVVGLLSPAFDEREVSAHLEKIARFPSRPFLEVVDALEFVTGVQLTQEKQSLVESRLQKRLFALGCGSIAAYAAHFLSHLREELPQAISLVTTHTTEFFREESHFDHLLEDVFPRLLEQRNTVSVWSAAASTGQEVYSLAIAFCEFLRTNPEVAARQPTFEIVGTDIDSASLDIAKEGIYRREAVAGLSQDLIRRYFDEGSGPLTGHVRIKDHVHALCRFERMNILSPDSSLPKFDVIFLRNVLIYFSAKDVQTIADRLTQHLNPWGRLFLGHSESFSGVSTKFHGIGDAVYALKDHPAAVERKRHLRRPVASGDGDAIHDLILVGASTGGVEALKVLLERFSPGCPPILVVQHIPANFSTALASRLSEHCAIDVVEGHDGMAVLPSRAYIAPGGKQMKITRAGTQFFLEVNDDDPVGLHKPSVDYLFNSALPFSSEISLAAAILTGMGKDGATGLKNLRTAGAFTVAQDEATSVVFGMPAVAIEVGAAVSVLPLPRIAEALLDSFSRRRAA